VSALWIYRLFGGFGPFHVGATLIVLALGAFMIEARQRRILAPFRGADAGRK
jgi:hypothetical protein